VIRQPAPLSLQPASGSEPVRIAPRIAAEGLYVADMSPSEAESVATALLEHVRWLRSETP